ncbi:MAG: AsmA family protein [Bacteroidales bacterium]|jgi:hypothetical protein|nr:AsmA family protein [Bacteroidales bacterium]
MKRKSFKKAIIIIVCVIVAFFILIIVTPIFFQKQLVNFALKEANKMLYAEVSIEDFHLSLIRNFPNPTLKMEGVKVINKVNFEGDTLANVGKIDACFDLWSIFSDTYHLRKLSIEDATINVKFDETGNFNCDIMIPDSLQIEDTTPSEPFHFNLKADKISLKNTNIHYSDFPGDMFADIENLNLNFTGNLSDEITEIKLNLDTKALSFKMDGVKFLNKAVISINTLLDADLNNWKFTLKENEINLNALALQLEGWVALPENNIDMDLKLALKNTDFKNLLSLIPAIYAKDFADIQTAGQLAFSGFAKGTLADDDFPAFGLNLQIANAMFKYPDLPTDVHEINILANVYNNIGKNLDNTVVDIQKFHFVILQNPFDIVANIKTPLSDPNINVSAKGCLNLADVQKIYPFDEATELNGIFNIDVALKGLMSYLDNEEYDKFDASGNMTIKDLVLKNTEMFDKNVFIDEAQLNFTSKYADLQKLQIKIGDNDLSINGKIENYIPFVFSDSAQLKGNLAVFSNCLNVTDLMSQPIANSTETVETSTSQTSSNLESSETPMEIIEVPDFLDINADINVKKLIYDNIDLQNALLVVTVQNSRLTIKKLAADLFKGNIMVNGIYETPDKNTAKSQISLNINKIAPKELVTTFGLFEKFMPILKHAEGLVSLNLNGDMNFVESMTPDYKSVNLNGNLGLIDLHLQDVDALKNLASALKMDKFKSFSLKDINLAFAVVEGKMLTNPFKFKIDKTNIAVDKGAIGLDKSLDFNSLFEIPKAIMGEKALGMLNQLTSKAKSLGLPVNESDVVKLNLKIGGTFDKPTFDVGLEKSKEEIKETVKEAIKEKVEEVKEQVKETIKETVNKALEEAQKQADALVAEARKQTDALIKAEKEAGEKIIAKAQAEADKMIAEAKNPIEKKAKEVAAKKIIEEAQKKADKANAETKIKADKIVADAKAKGDKLIEEARNKNN